MTHKELFSVEGLMCGTCLVEVLERLHDLDGVVEVGISLRVGGHSPVVVRSDELVAPEALVTAVTEAGFTVTDHSLSTRPPGRDPLVVRDNRDCTAADQMPIGGGWR
ncbi:heavy-metal-associated domain-containing protein [Cellulomonas sp. KRMCY2]|uniref:heavy-metal-associated domain-containing protein n=1 Tax=Cellulomonas sp. KRMCY2 TaxID=1304865 RepID=UPI00045EC355|nr:heavy-metal-associated domain-containing protein [Cellulomonas sp. KRMCY2]